MENSTVIATGYLVTIVCLDDDYYYGVFQRTYESGRKEFLSFVKIDLDDGYESIELPLFKEDEQCMVDFEIDGFENDAIEGLQERLLPNIVEYKHEIIHNIRMDRNAAIEYLTMN